MSAILRPKRCTSLDRRHNGNAAGKTDKVSVLVGTIKGAFFFHSDAERKNWKMTGPHLDGWEIYSLYGQRARPTGIKIMEAMARQDLRRHIAFRLWPHDPRQRGYGGDLDAG